VVIVFLGGLGAGSWLAGRVAGHLRNPLVTLAYLELLLGALTSGIRALLSTDLAESVFAAERVAQAFGTPLWLIYGAVALLLLTPPCLVMGATIPLAAEGCQRRLAERDASRLAWLIAANTFGAVAGTVAASWHLLPEHGQSASLLAAIALNLMAGLLVLSMRARVAVDAPVIDAAPAAARPAGATPGRLAWLALALGFCALAYEMLLLRMVALRHEPLPYTFAAVLTGFLVYWSLGAALSAWRRGLSFAAAAGACGLLVAACQPLLMIDTPSPATTVAALAWFLASRCLYFVPCLLFGYLFGRVVIAAAESWGRDVGRVYAFNTAGSCAGVVAMTLVGYEIPFFLAATALSLLMLAVRDLERTRATGPSRRWMLPSTVAVAVALLPFVVDFTDALGLPMFSSRNGVILVDGSGNLIWDGLWHSRLSRDGDHVGTANWYLAVAPVVAHAGPTTDALVIGVGAGVTAATIAKTGAAVDAYDINRGLLRLFRRYPEGTLGVADNPAISIRWQDARSGLALSDKRFDVVQTQPLYLKQAGSSLLNSEQFFRLVSRRLKPGGVFCLYSNGTPAQALVVRQTAARVFPHRVSFSNGYLLLLSNDPIDLGEASLRERYRGSGPFWDEVRAHERTRDASAFLQLFDPPDFPWGRGDLVTTDDHPIVEYPNVVEARARALGYRNLPAPGIVR
jgi:spermidine synthase